MIQSRNNAPILPCMDTQDCPGPEKQVIHQAGRHIKHFRKQKSKCSQALAQKGVDWIQGMPKHATARLGRRECPPRAGG